MSDEQDSPYIKQSLWLFASSVLLIVVHYIALKHFQVAPGDDDLKAIIAYIPREVAVALLIAAVLNIFVEKNTQRRHAKLEQRVQERLASNAEQLHAEMRKNLLRTVFSQNLGKNVIAQVEEKLFEPAPYREELDVTYCITIELDTEGRRFVKITASYRYVLFNPSRQAAEPDVAFASSSPDEFAAHVSIRKIECEGVPLVRPEEFDKYVDAGTINFERARAFNLACNSRKCVELSSSRADYLEGNESYATTAPTEVMRITVQHPAELQVGAMSLHPRDLEIINSTPTSKIWRLLGLVAGQGIVFWWRPASRTLKPPSVSAGNQV